MRNKSFFKNKKIAIVGLARSGVACANLLAGLGAKVSATDSKDDHLVRENAAKLRPKDIRLEFGGHTREFIKGHDLLIISPGVPNNALPVIWAKEQNIPALSEIEIGWMLCPATVIAVTGSNGKTTTTTLISMVIQASGRKVFTCGNIGAPFCGEVEKITEGDFVSLEVSSFQLESIDKFKPKVALILNFTPNHLDRHKDMQEYLDAKKMIFKNQDSSDYLILNGADSVLRGLEKEAKSKVVYFSETLGIDPNQAAVIKVASALGIEEDICRSVFKDFKGIEHRQEFVAEINKIRFINDSKATTADSTIRALKNISGPVLLIAGGRHKGIDYSVIREAAINKVKDVILIGEARGVIKSGLGGFLNTQEAKDIEQAVQKAFEAAKPGDTVLLSPMCSSYDMFTDYEERGRAFKAAVHELVKVKI